MAAPSPIATPDHSSRRAANATNAAVARATATRSQFTVPVSSSVGARANHSARRPTSAHRLAAIATAAAARIAAFTK